MALWILCQSLLLSEQQSCCRFLSANSFECVTSSTDFSWARLVTSQEMCRVAIGRQKVEIEIERTIQYIQLACTAIGAAVIWSFIGILVTSDADNRPTSLDHSCNAMPRTDVC